MDMPTQESAYIEYTDGYKYQLNKTTIIFTGILGFDIVTEFVHLYENGFMEVFKYYAWDGASGPTVDTKSSMRFSLAHDVLYQLMRLGLLPHTLKDKVDNMVLTIGKRDGMWKLRTNIWERALNWFGGPNVLPSGEKHILRAP